MDKQSSTIDPFLLDYQPSELRIASEFFSTWLPFLSKDLCRNCSQSLSDRIRSIDPESENENRNKNSEEVNLDENCDCHSLGSWNDGVQENSASEVPSPRMSWADMAQEDDEFGEDEIGIDRNDDNAVVGGVVLGENSGEDRVVADKAVLPREQREYIRFMNVRRKKDFICIERINGKLVNIVEGLELHTGIFSAAEQKRIVGYVASLQEMGRKGELKERTYSAPKKWMKGKGRQTIQFGCCYNYAVDKDGNPPGILHRASIDPLPDLFKVIIRRLVKWHVLPTTCVPDSCIVNVYEEGDCIPPHIDNHDFVRPFCTVSFLSECDILFGSNLRIVGPGEFDGVFAIPLPVGSVLVLNGNGADVAKHCVPAVPAKRISITFRRMDESKRPAGYVPEPDLQGIQPLAYEAEQEESNKSSGGHNRSNDRQMSRNNDRRGGRIDGMGSAPRNDRFSEPREWSQNSQRSAPTRNNRYSEPREWSQNSQRSATRNNRYNDRYSEPRQSPQSSQRSNDRYSEPRQSPQGSQRSANRWSRVKPTN
ncbi:RNA demethylase ALKBH9B-like [Vicia villosa]|uniref:RNA demethylase ALKBH9B-like n=1 Tax=Vicia villosa TaxID=3911 RepID=UPI00273B1C00|nr:RNA demethylase ALKBH9B-like [Vicia villosa]